MKSCVGKVRTNAPSLASNHDVTFSLRRVAWRRVLPIVQLALALSLFSLSQLQRRAMHFYEPIPDFVTHAELVSDFLNFPALLATKLATVWGAPDGAWVCECGSLYLSAYDICFFCNVVLFWYWVGLKFDRRLGFTGFFRLRPKLLLAVASLGAALMFLGAVWSTAGNSIALSYVIVVPIMIYLLNYPFQQNGLPPLVSDCALTIVSVFFMIVCFQGLLQSLPDFSYWWHVSPKSALKSLSYSLNAIRIAGIIWCSFFSVHFGHKFIRLLHNKSQSRVLVSG